MSGTLFDLGQALRWVPGARLVGDPRSGVQRVHTDTRTLQAGDLFVALRGERFDAHDFLGQLGAHGVHLAMAERGLMQAGLSGLEVPDSRAALGQLAQGWRSAHDVRLIAVTGSNGKTTVTQMVAAVLKAHVGEAALSTQGNFNNDIGVPLTLLRLRQHHRLAVLELGMNHPGEIAQLAAWAQPQVALVNNAQREHQEFMHSVRAVAQENGAVLRALARDGVAVFPADDAHTSIWQELAGDRTVLTFGVHGDVRAERVTRTELGWTGRMVCPARGVGFDFELAMPGEHNLRNAMAATACALSVDVPVQAIAQGLAHFQPVAGRSQAQSLVRGGQKITLIDDTYNANPDSVRAAIDVLTQMAAPRVLVLGDMGEVGDQGPAFHAEVGRYARERGIEHLLTLGQQAALAAQAHGHAGHHEAIESLCAELDRLCTQARSVLVKGSRFMKMERVVRHLQASQEPATC
jgi:UDP-N-acetylmuramoyl-tripeptide--D-alanyl-D-alanine ligase